jgi:hypothetical protein
MNQSTAVIVTLVPVLRTVVNLDEKSQVLHTFIGLKLSWKFETLTWDASDFGGTGTIKVSPNSVWIPEITFKNSLEDNYNLLKSDSMKILIAADGTAGWAIGAHLTMTCAVDISKYPFDTQKCKIVFGKINSFDHEVLLVPVSRSVSTVAYEENDEWYLADSNAAYKMITHDLTYVEVELVLERRPKFYILNIIIPVVSLSMMNMLSFKLPIAS